MTEVVAEPKKVIPRKRAKPAVTEEPAAKKINPRKVMFSCDRHIRLRVVIPKWIKNEKMILAPHVEFLGGRLDMGRVMDRLGLTDEEAMQAIEVLLNTQYVYVERGIDTPRKCGFCGKVFGTPVQLRQHSLIMHGERLNLVPARHDLE